MSCQSCEKLRDTLIAVKKELMFHDKERWAGHRNTALAMIDQALQPTPGECKLCGDSGLEVEKDPLTDGTMVSASPRPNGCKPKNGR